jgi:hypothetical protein
MDIWDCIMFIQNVQARWMIKHLVALAQKERVGGATVKIQTPTLESAAMVAFGRKG